MHQPYRSHPALRKGPQYQNRAGPLGDFKTAWCPSQTQNSFFAFSCDDAHAHVISCCHGHSMKRTVRMRATKSNMAYACRLACTHPHKARQLAGPQLRCELGVGRSSKNGLVAASLCHDSCVQVDVGNPTPHLFRCCYEGGDRNWRPS